MSLSPYPITLSGNNGFNFLTDSGHTYFVYFDGSSQIFPDERVNKLTYYFGFTCTPALKMLERNYDPRVGTTIMLIIANFLANNPKAILAYMCSALDQQDRHRNISFGKWYSTSILKDKFELLKSKLEDTYCGVIYDKKHPKIEIIEEAFLSFTFDKLDSVEENAEPYFFEDEEAE